MSIATTPAWEAKRTDETRKVKELLRQHFQQADCYRYNSASIRVRVIDSKFEGMAREKRDAAVEPYLDMLPEDTQRDIVTLFTFAPSELELTPKTHREFTLNAEFDDPSPSIL
jgi:stress-induced morphogen